jgi:hypothetical protein
MSSYHGTVIAGVRFASILLLLMLLTARVADACQCDAIGPPCQNFFEVHAVFAGTVRSVMPVPRVPTAMENVRVEFEDTIAFRGVEGPTQTVMTSAPGVGACAYPFKRGERYVVYAYRTKPGEPLSTTICSRTRPIADAAEDLLFFQSLSNATGGPRVFGSITHTEPGTMYREGPNYGAVANVRLALRSDSATYNATTDANGRYELTGMPPAAYQLGVTPPPELTPYDRETQAIALSDNHSCVEKNFVLHFDGRVRGSIREATGGPAAGVRVQLMRIEYVDRTDLIETIDAAADSSGRFEFSGITPGRYVLGVDLLRQFYLASDTDAVFRPTYHPGTPDSSRATIIDLRGGERHDLVSMTLPPALRAHRLTGVVTYTDGTPAAGAFVMLQDPIKKWLDVAEPFETDARGAFAFTVHEGLSYTISVWYAERVRGRLPMPTTVGPFVVTKQPAPVHIVIAPRR